MKSRPSREENRFSTEPGWVEEALPAVQGLNFLPSNWYSPSAVPSHICPSGVCAMLLGGLSRPSSPIRHTLCPYWLIECTGSTARAARASSSSAAKTTIANSDRSVSITSPLRLAEPSSINSSTSHRRGAAHLAASSTRQRRHQPITVRLGRPLLKRPQPNAAEPVEMPNNSPRAASRPVRSPSAFHNDTAAHGVITSERGTKNIAQPKNLCGGNTGGTNSGGQPENAVTRGSRDFADTAADRNLRKPLPDDHLAILQTVETAVVGLQGQFWIRTHRDWTIALHFHDGRTG